MPQDGIRGLLLEMKAGGLALTSEAEERSGVEALWARHTNGDPDARNELIVHYAPMVKFVASRVASGLPQSVEHADLVSYGVFGLIDAISKFEPEMGNRFETYAIPRVKGAMLDALRSNDWVPRSVRSKAREVENALSALETRFGRAPTEDEVAEELELSVPQLHDRLSKISSLGIVALDEVLAGDRGDAFTVGDTLADGGPGPTSALESSEMRQRLASAINIMGDRDKLVLTLYYYEGLTLSEIGGVLKVTESRVCQIHTKAVLHLRSRLAAEDRERRANQV